MTHTAHHADAATDESPKGTVETIDPVSDPRWRALLTGRRSDVFHSPEWLRALRDAYGVTPLANVLLDEDGAPCAGLVYAPIADMMDPRVVSLPFSDFCDPLVDTYAQWRAVSAGVVEADRRFQLKCLHSTVPLDDPLLETVDRARWHAVDLARPTGEIWDSLAPSARRSIRKARKEGVEIRRGDSVDDMRSFFELHLRVRKYKYGLLAQPWSFFERLWDLMLADGRGVLLLARHGNEVLAGVVFLEWQDTLYYKFNASDAEGLGVRPNDLVIWEAIEHGSERGLHRLDFGLSDWDQEGLLRFKRKYATEEKAIHVLRHMPVGMPTDREREFREVLPQLTVLFTDPAVPDASTEQAGTLLYRYFT